MQGTLRKHSGNTRGTFRERSGTTEGNKEEDKEEEEDKKKVFSASDHAKANDTNKKKWD
jgi:hypothetical protein